MFILAQSNLLIESRLNACFIIHFAYPKTHKQKSGSVKQTAFESICAELNRPAGRGILQGKGSSLLYDCADVNGIIQILAECMLPAF